MSERERWVVYPLLFLALGVALRDKINRFFEYMNNSGRFKKIYDRYYADVQEFNYLDLRAFQRRIRKRLPRYQKTIVAAALRAGFDWRLVAAQIYQESHMLPNAVSPSGAVGLMQIIEKTGESLGIGNLFDPRENIRAGVRHLKRLYDHYDGADGRDRRQIALAAYNVGQGHIHDARNLARAQGLDPDTWKALTRTLPMLQYRKYYEQAKYGYCRGTEPVRYVRQIMIYYDILRRWDIRYEH